MDVIKKILGLNGGATAPETDAATIDNNRKGYVKQSDDLMVV